MNVVDEIKTTLPPIAGVANAAMVLHDVLFSDMSFDQMQECLQPKIDGTNHLAEAFHHDKLDFFIMFSSIMCVRGNAGQSNYAAANAYMVGLANQRRKRGLAASAVDISQVHGVGYIERRDQSIKEHLTRTGYMVISESDIHHMFAETIRAGYPDLGAYPIVTTGISGTRSEQGAQLAIGVDDPRFSHCIANAGGANVKKDEKSATLPVSEQLAGATSTDEALEIIKGRSIDSRANTFVC